MTLNSNIASVVKTSSGYKITGVGTGSTKIRFTAHDGGGATSECSVTVTEPGPYYTIETASTLYNVEAQVPFTITGTITPSVEGYTEENFKLVYDDGETVLMTDELEGYMLEAIGNSFEITFIAGETVQGMGTYHIEVETDEGTGSSNPIDINGIGPEPGDVKVTNVVPTLNGLILEGEYDDDEKAWVYGIAHGYRTGDNLLTLEVLPSDATNKNVTVTTPQGGMDITQTDEGYILNVQSGYEDNYIYINITPQNPADSFTKSYFIIKCDQNPPTPAPSHLSVVGPEEAVTGIQFTVQIEAEDYVSGMENSITLTDDSAKSVSNAGISTSITPSSIYVDDTTGYINYKFNAYKTANVYFEFEFNNGSTVVTSNKLYVTVGDGK